jgi:hypothetical protein
MPGALLRRQMSPFQQLWNDIGAQCPATWAVDDQGFPHCESEVAVTARDLARIGLLVIDAGRIAGPRGVRLAASLAYREDGDRS